MTDAHDTAEAALSISISDATALEHTLIRTLMLLRDQQPRVLKAGGVSRTFYKKMAGNLGDSVCPAWMDAESFHGFVVAILISAGLTAEREGRLHEDPDACESFFALDPEHRTQALREAWLASDLLNEFTSLTHLHVPGARSGSAGSRADHVPGARRLQAVRARLVELLDEEPLGAWVKGEAFLERVQQHAPDLLIPDDGTPIAKSSTYLGLRLREAKIDLVREGNWERVEGALVNAMLAGPLCLLGWIDLGHHETEASHPDTPHAPVALRRRRQPREERSVPVSEKPLLIQGNFEVTALLPEMSALALWKLARLANVNAFEQVAHFQIEERLVAQVVNEGTSLDEVCDYLENHSKTGLPQNVRYTLSEWVKRTERITIWPDAYIFQAEGVEDLASIVSEAYRKRAGLAALGEKHMIGAADQTPDPKEGVPARYPVLDYSRPLAPVVTAHRNGVLSCEPEQVNFRVTQALSRIAESISIERWRLTQASVTEALKKGMSFDRVMEVLLSVLKNELPPLLRARLLVWSERFGAAAIGDTRVLSFEFAESAQLLRHDETFADLLARPLNPTTFLIDAENEEAARKALEDLSMSIEEGVHTSHDARDSRGPVQIASVRTSPARRGDAFDLPAFQRNWNAGRRDQALDDAVAHNVRLTALVQFSSDAPPKRVQLEPVRWVGFDGGGYLEARVDHQETRVLPLAAIFEAEPVE